MGIPLYLLISGDVLYLGLCLLGLGVVVAPWYRAFGRALVTVGLILAMVSAVPLHPGIYSLLLVASAAWLLLGLRRSTKWAMTLLVLATLAWTGTTGLAARRSGSPLSPGRPVFVLGDSISAGVGPRGEDTWPQLLAVQRSLSVTNLANPGATLASGATQARAIPLDGAIVLVELGGNDLLAGATPAEFEADLRRLLATLIGADRRVLMFELPLLPFQNAFGRIQREACRQHGVTLLPRSILAGAIALPGHAIDGLHLSPRGHAWLAERVSCLWADGRRSVTTAVALAPAVMLAAASDRDAALRPETVMVLSGTLKLRAALWRPQGPGPFPAVLFNHGIGRPTDTPAGQQDQRNRLREPAILGPTFVRHGYVFLYPFRRGAGLSAGEGTAGGDLMEKEIARHGQEGLNRVQLQLLEKDEMSDAMAGLAFLRALPEVDPRRIAVAGHSFGGSLTLLMAERDPSLRAAVDFAGAAGSWEASPPLQARLLAAVGDTKVPVFFIHAANDFSVAPAHRLGEEMARLERPHRVKVYPAVGATAEDGHRFVYLSVATWEADVFAFLDEHLK